MDPASCLPPYQDTPESLPLCSNLIHNVQTTLRQSIHNFPDEELEITDDEIYELDANAEQELMNDVDEHNEHERIELTWNTLFPNDDFATMSNTMRARNPSSNFRDILERMDQIINDEIQHREQQEQQIDELMNISTIGGRTQRSHEERHQTK